MDQAILSKVTRVAQEYRYRKKKRGFSKRGPYWFGTYQENGKTERVYIGKELPEELHALLEARIKPLGHRNYFWPGRRGEGG